MQIVIDIPQNLADMILKRECFDISYGFKLASCVRNGTVLPKGHGKLIDATKIPYHNIRLHIHGERMAYEYEVDEIPAIIEADKEKEK